MRWKLGPFTEEDIARSELREALGRKTEIDAEVAEIICRLETIRPKPSAASRPHTNNGWRWLPSFYPPRY